MSQRRPGGRESFTVSEANATLPLVGAIVADLAALSREVIDRRRRLSFLMAGRDPNDRDLYHQELVQIEDELEKDKRRLREYTEELRTIGVELINGPEGIVSFPATMDDRKVCLSWKLGERDVRYWHPYGAGFADRRPLSSDHFRRADLQKLGNPERSS
jgi:hypothetical protein